MRKGLAGNKVGFAVRAFLIVDYTVGVNMSRLDSDKLMGLYIPKFSVESGRSVLSAHGFLCFNSTLVRVKSVFGSPEPPPLPHYNSTLVQVKACLNVNQITTLKDISIPQWFE